MTSKALVVTLALMAFGAGSGFAGPPSDTDGDTIQDINDNCSDVLNPGQVDSDVDDCGNVCDADWDNSGVVGFSDFGAFAIAFGTFDLEFDISEPVVGPVGFADFGAFAILFGAAAGPSGTTPGSVACP